MLRIFLYFALLITPSIVQAQDTKNLTILRAQKTIDTMTCKFFQGNGKDIFVISEKSPSRISKEKVHECISYLPVTTILIGRKLICDHKDNLYVVGFAFNIPDDFDEEVTRCFKELDGTEVVLNQKPRNSGLFVLFSHYFFLLLFKKSF